MSDTTTEICLIIPPDGDPAALADALRLALAELEPSALLLPRGGRDHAAYEALAQALIGPAQAAGAAVILEGDAALVRRLGADGLHVTGGIEALREAIAALKPDLIVGIGDAGTRHDAMQQAELSIDYILFGPLSGATTTEMREMARWWAETMEVPAILSDPEATASAFDAEGCEFIGLALPGAQR